MLAEQPDHLGGDSTRLFGQHRPDCFFDGLLGMKTNHPAGCDGVATMLRTT
jgi:hypothetical protein